MYSSMSPSGIQFETSCWGEIVTPRRGKTFGCAKCFHVMAALQKSCKFVQRRQTEKVEGSISTLAFLCVSSWVYVRIRFTQTFEPSRVPTYTSPEPPELNAIESVSIS